MFLRRHVPREARTFNSNAPRRCGEPRLRCSLSLRPLQHQLAHARLISLAAHGLHDGTDHGAGRLHFALADLLENIRLRCERRVDGRDERTVVRDNLQAS